MKHLTDAEMRDLMNEPHALFHGYQEHGYGKLNLAVALNSDAKFTRPGALKLTAQIGHNSGDMVESCLRDPGGVAYAKRVELDAFVEGLTVARLKIHMGVLQRYEKALEERNLWAGSTPYETLARLLVQAAKIRYVLVNPVLPNGVHQFVSSRGVYGWGVLDMRDMTDVSRFAQVTRSTAENLFRHVTPAHLLSAAQQKVNAEREAA